MFPGLSIKEPPFDAALPVTRRRLSPTAPKAMLVARPPYCQSLLKREAGTRDSRNSYGVFGGNGSNPGGVYVETVSISACFARYRVWQAVTYF